MMNTVFFNPRLSYFTAVFFVVISMSVGCAPQITLLKSDERPVAIQHRHWQSIIDDADADAHQITIAAWNAWFFTNDWQSAYRGFRKSWSTTHDLVAGLGLAEVCTHGPCAEEGAAAWLSLLETPALSVRRMALYRLLSLVDRVPNLANDLLPAVRKLTARTEGSELLDVQMAEITLIQRVHGDRLPLPNAPTTWRVDGPYRGPTWPPARWTANETRQQRSVQAPLGSLILHPLEPGAFRAETSINISETGNYVWRISGDCPIRVELDEIPLYDNEARLSYSGATHDVITTSVAGTKRLVVWAKTSHGGQTIVIRFAKTQRVTPPHNDLESFPPPLDAWIRATTALATADLHTAEIEINKLRSVSDTWAALRSTTAQQIVLDLTIPPEIREDQSEQDLQWAISVDPHQVMVRAELIRRLIRAGALQAAEEMAREGIKQQRVFGAIDGTFEVLGAQIGDLQGYKPEAEAVLSALLETHPGNCEARRTLVEMLLDRPKEALRWLNLPPGPNACPQTVRLPLAIALRTGDGETAVAHARKLRELEPENDSLFRDGIRALVLAKQQNAARELLNTRAQQIESGGEYDFWAADIAAELNDITTSRNEWSALSTAPNIDPEHRRKLAVLGFDPIFSQFRLNGLDIAAKYRTSPNIQASAVFVLDDWIAVYFSDGSAAYRTHVLIQALNETAVDQLGELELPIGAELERVRTIKPDGSVLEPEDIDEKDTLSLVDLEVGDMIEVAYIRFDDGDPKLAPARTAETFYFQSPDAPVVTSRCLLIHANGLQPQVWLRPGSGIAPEPIRDLAAPTGFQVQGYIARNLPQARLEPLATQPSAELPRLTVSTARWEQLREVIANQIHELEEIPQDLTSTLTKITAQRRDNAEKIGDVFRLIRRSIAEDPGSFLNTPATYTWARKSGERVILLWTALRYCGWDARLVLLHAANVNDDDLRDGANRERYNYPVVMVPIENQQIWLDLASGDTVFDYLPPILQNRPGIDPLAGGPHAELFTPTYPPQRDRHSVLVEGHIDPQGHFSGTVNETQYGSLALQSRHFLVVSDDSTQREAIQVRLNKSIPLVTINDVEIIDLYQPDAPLRLRYSFSAPVGANKGAGTRELELRLFPEDLSKTYASIPHRTTTVWVNPPPFQEIEIRLTIDPTLEFYEMPQRSEIKNALVAMSVASKLERTSKTEEYLKIVKEWRFQPQVITPEAYDLLRITASRVDRMDRVRVSIGPKRNGVPTTRE